MGGDVTVKRQGDLLEVVDALDAATPPWPPRERAEACRSGGDDRHHHEKLDQGEGLVASHGRTSTHWHDNGHVKSEPSELVRIDHFAIRPVGQVLIDREPIDS